MFKLLPYRDAEISGCGGLTVGDEEGFAGGGAHGKKVVDGEDVGVRYIGDVGKVAEVIAGTEYEWGLAARDTAVEKRDTGCIVGAENGRGSQRAS